MTTLADILNAARAMPRAVLGTLVDVRGSSYRRPGARVLVGEDGRRVGMISGGCLEREVVRQAFALTEGGPTLASYDTRGDALRPFGAYGSGCEGIVSLWLERVGGPSCALGAIEAAWAAGEALGVATVYDAQGAGEALLGRRATLRAGAWSGDPSVEEVFGEAVAGAWGARWPSAVTASVGGGEVTALVEHLPPPPELLVYGAGDDVQPLVAMAAAMGWAVHVVDRWPALATTARFPQAASVRCVAPEVAGEAVTIRPWTHALLMTHSLRDDLVLLPMLLDSPSPWIGLLGPRRRTMRLMAELASRGRLPDAEALARVQTPAGLDLGAEAPEEVALSVLAGLVAARNGACGGLLRDASGAIHAEHARLRLLPDPGEGVGT